MSQADLHRDRGSNGRAVLRGALRTLARAAVLAGLLATAATARAQTPAEPAEDEARPAEAAARVVSQDPLGRDTPRQAVLGYIEACRDGDFETAGQYLDMSRVSPEVRETGAAELARRLKIVLDQKLWIEPEKLSDQVEGYVDDGLSPGVDQVGTIALPSGREVPMLVNQQDAGDPRPWLISSSTVERIPQLWGAFGHGWIGEYLPPAFFELRLFEVQLWQWIGLMLFVVVAWLLSLIAVAIVNRVLKPFVSRTETEIDDQLLKLANSPLRLAFAIAFFAVTSLSLGLAVPAQETLTGVEKGLAVVAAAWLLLRVIDMVSGILLARFEAEDRPAAVAVIPAGRRAAKIAILALAVLAMLQNLGFNVTGLVAGLGIGGLAVALAAQKTIENFFGGLAVIADQPVRVGDFCNFGGRVGTVEDVGIWSTRIRTLDRTVVSIPNGQFSGYELENYARRDRMRLYTTIGLRYETTPDQLRHVLAGLRRVLLAHPRVLPEPARVRFVGYGASSLDLEVFAYVDTEDYNEFLGIREDIYLRFMDVVEESGTGFAFPSQTLYFGRDSGLDEERARAAEAEVKRWRDEGQLPFPGESEEMIRQLDDSLDWPPTGSVTRPSS